MFTKKFVAKCASGDSKMKMNKNINMSKYVESIRQEAKESRKRKREAVKRVDDWVKDMEDNPQKYCRHYEGNMVAEGIKCKQCGLVEKIN